MFTPNGVNMHGRTNGFVKQPCSKQWNKYRTRVSSIQPYDDKGSLAPPLYFFS